VTSGASFLESNLFSDVSPMGWRGKSAFTRVAISTRSTESSPSPKGGEPIVKDGLGAIVWNN
jgi:hypothetical protein